MGLLGENYASPQFLLDWAVDSGNLVEFILKIYEDRNERMFWEVYLHSQTELSFEDFKKAQTDKTKAQKATPAQLSTIINTSRTILNSFNPKEGDEYS